MAASNRPQEPWNSFLKELDSAMNTIVRLDCIGGLLSPSCTDLIALPLMSILWSLRPAEQLRQSWNSAAAAVRST